MRIVAIHLDSWVLSWPHGSLKTSRIQIDAREHVQCPFTKQIHIIFDQFFAESLIYLLVQIVSILLLHLIQHLSILALKSPVGLTGFLDLPTTFRSKMTNTNCRHATLTRPIVTCSTLKLEMISGCISGQDPAFKTTRGCGRNKTINWCWDSFRFKCREVKTQRAC